MKTYISILVALTFGAGSLKADNWFENFQRQNQLDRIEWQQRRIEDQIEINRQEDEYRSMRDRRELREAIEQLEDELECE